MNVKKWRQNKGLTLAQLSEKIGYAQSYLSDVENGKKPPSGRLLMAYDQISQGKIRPSDFNTSTDYHQ